MRVARLALAATVVACWFGLTALAAQADTDVDSTFAAASDDGVLTGAAWNEGGRGAGGGRSCEYSAVDATTGSPDNAGRRSEPVHMTENAIFYIMFQRTCDDGTTTTVWIPQLTAQDLLGPLLDHVEDRLHLPEAVFQPIDEDYGWTYVQVPVDFRTTPETWEPIVVTAAIDGPPGFAPWVTITATPTELWLASGDPNDPGPVAGCRGAQAVAPYVAATPGACSYTFRNASTIMADGVFPAELGIVWDVSYESSDGPGTLSVEPTVNAAPIRVSEIKALVVCTGPDPLQGGCGAG